MSQNRNAPCSVQMTETGERKITAGTTEAAASLNCNVQQEGRMKFTDYQVSLLLGPSFPQFCIQDQINEFVKQK